MYLHVDVATAATSAVAVGGVAVGGVAVVVVVGGGGKCRPFISSLDDVYLCVSCTHIYSVYLYVRGRVHIYVYARARVCVCVCVCAQVPALRQELASIKEKRLALLKDYQALNLELKQAKEETSAVREVRRDTPFMTIRHMKIS